MTKPEGVPYLDLSKEFNVLKDEWFAMISEDGAHGSWILGPNVHAFEKEVAEFIGCRYAIGVANGTDALYLSLRALGIGPGDEVITTPYTFFATSEVIDMVGARPVFVDIEVDSFNIDPVLVEQAVTEKTRAIIPVHLFGNPADMTAINAIAEKYDLAVVEDAAQAFGAQHDGQRVGSMGHTGCFSFYPTKVLGCYGDGGLLTTDSDEIAEAVRKLRNHGAAAAFQHDEIGMNSRLDEVQAALLRLKLKKLDENIASRQRIAGMYDKRLAKLGIICPIRPEHGSHAFNLYTIRSTKVDTIRQALMENAIGNSTCYPVPLALQEVYQHLKYSADNFPVSVALGNEVVSLPVFPDMTELQVDRVCHVIEVAISIN
ncbi:UDP-2-acetamido-2-deoxy-3-oxo-D-glucuronate aminotransferase [bacterium BMS3Abin11]|nr:UDP-2-acetamido-2-deoxy-3-oxo-D-glucuronate aminotransferase [bacterium BMS3Abin11]